LKRIPSEKSIEQLLPGNWTPLSTITR
jgi:hypothetical protein